MNKQSEKKLHSGFTAVIPAAGSSSRMGNVDKLHIDLDNKPVIIRTLEVFESYPQCREIILVSSPSNMDSFHDLVRRYGIQKVKKIVEGGKRRQDSVYNGLLNVETEYVAVHDGARPLLSDELLSRLYDNAKEFSNCIPVLPVKDTIKVIDENFFVKETPGRERLFIAQTPQFFLTEILIDAFEKTAELDVPVTDDSSMVELAGYSVRAVMGEPENIKITTLEDIIVARTFYRNKVR
jgi:2-C-methyl-D-erythritol 4-phosphate cytidylyltransferase